MKRAKILFIIGKTYNIYNVNGMMKEITAVIK